MPEASLVDLNLPIHASATLRHSFVFMLELSSDVEHIAIDFRELSWGLSCDRSKVPERNQKASLR